MSPQEAIKMLRAEIGLTQIELAEKLSIGFSTLNRWENGKAFPNRVNANNIIRTARDMDVSEGCLHYLSDVLLPSRMRGRPAAELGFPELDQELLCQIVDGSTAGVVLIDEQTKRLIYVNRRAEEMAGAKFYDLAADERYCWRYLKRKDAQCADCEPARYPLTGHCEWTDTTHDGKEFRNRTRSIIWKGKKIYVAYMSDATELIESKKEARMLTSLFPAGAGIFHVFADGRIELVDAFYQETHSSRGKAMRYTGPRTLASVLGDDTAALIDEVRSAILESRDVSAIFRAASSGRWVQLYARQFWQDDEKRSFFCSFTDADWYMEALRAAESTKPNA